MAPSTRFQRFQADPQQEQRARNPWGAAAGTTYWLPEVPPQQGCHVRTHRIQAQASLRSLSLSFSRSASQQRAKEHEAGRTAKGSTTRTERGSRAQPLQPPPGCPTDGGCWGRVLQRIHPHDTLTPRHAGLPNAPPSGSNDGQPSDTTRDPPPLLRELHLLILLRTPCSSLVQRSTAHALRAHSSPRPSQDTSHWLRRQSRRIRQQCAHPHCALQ